MGRGALVGVGRLMGDDIRMRRSTAVDGNRLTSNERRRIREKEPDKVGDLLGVGDATERVSTTEELQGGVFTMTPGVFSPSIALAPYLTPKNTPSRFTRTSSRPRSFATSKGLDARFALSSSRRSPGPITASEAPFL